MKLYKVLIFVVAPLILSCTNNTRSKPDKGTITGRVYTSQELGWTMQIPKGWKIIKTDFLKKATQKNIDTIERQTGLHIKPQGMKLLLNFLKDKANSLTSTSMPYLSDSIHFNEVIKMTSQTLYNTYHNLGMAADTASGSMIVDGLKFNVLYVTINNPNCGITSQQILFTRLINGYNFDLVITYNNDIYKQVMLDAFMNSKFDYSNNNPWANQ